MGVWELGDEVWGLALDMVVAIDGGTGVEFGFGDSDDAAQCAATPRIEVGDGEGGGSARKSVGQAGEDDEVAFHWHPDDLLAFSEIPASDALEVEDGWVAFAEGFT